MKLYAALQRPSDLISESLRLPFRHLGTSGRWLCTATYISLTAQTLLEFGLIAALGFLYSKNLPAALVLATLVARLFTGFASIILAARLGSICRRNVQQNLWKFTNSIAGYERAQRSPADHHRILSQAPTDVAVGIVVPGIQILADATALLTLATAVILWAPAAGSIVILAVSALATGAAWSIRVGSGAASIKEAQALEEAHQLSWDVTHGARDILINDAERLVSVRSAPVARGLKTATNAYLLWTGGQRAVLEGLSLALVAALALLSEQIGLGLVAGIAVLRLIPILSRLGAAAAQLWNALSRTSAWSWTLNRAVPNTVAASPSISTSRPATQDIIVSVDVRLGARTEGRIRSPVRFDLARGAWLQIDGESGVGKSSVLDAIVGLWTEFEGEIRRMPNLTIGYASQAPFLLEGTVIDNLLLGRDLIWEGLDAAARVTGLDECFGDDYMKHQILDRGANLSGGQRQRVSIARAIAGRPSLLILDEATANLDAEAEKLLLHRIRHSLPRTAVIIVTHRLAPVGWTIEKVAM